MSHLRLTLTEARGHAIEAVHSVAAVAVDHTGQALLTVGGPCRTTWRSAAKPFQLEACLELLPSALTDDLSPQSLALGSASHSGQPEHVDGVRRLMATLGVAEAELACGAHAPVHAASAAALIRADQAPSPIHNNCSGKHTFMLAAQAAARDQGLPGAAPSCGYLEPASALQQRVAALVRRRTADEDLSAVVDGCGAPCFVLGLEGMARAWAALAVAFGGPTPLGRIAHALQAEPWWMSGDGRLDYDLVLAGREPIVSKVGAAGVLCLALPSRGIGLALKVLTGSDAVRPLAAQALLDRLAPNAVGDAPFAPYHIVRNVAGAPVGERRIAWS